MKFAGDTVSMLMKVYSEFQQKKLSLHMFLEMKTAENGRFRGNFAGRFRGLGGQHGKVPPNSMTHVGIPSLRFFVTLSFFFVKIPSGSAILTSAKNATI